MNEYKTINVHLFRPAFKDVKQRCEILSCNAYDQCEMYKQGKCVFQSSGLSVIRCPHASFHKETGYTQKAKSYYKWFEAKEKLYGDHIDKLKYDTTKMCIVGGDYVYLPYSYLRTYVNSIKDIEKDHFIPLHLFNKEKIKEIIDFIPLTLMEAAPITAYQNKEIPRFLQHLKEGFPDLLNEFLAEYPDYSDMVNKHTSNFIGRTAYIKTMAEDSVLTACHGNKWKIENGYLVGANSLSLIPFVVYKEPTEIKIKISESMEYKITDNSQVTPNTEFID